MPDTTPMSSLMNLPSYPEFVQREDPDISTKWEDWLEGFEAMLAAMRVTEQKERRNMLKYYIGASTRKVMKRLDNAGKDEDEDGYTKLRDALNGHFKPKLNRVYGMNMLHQVEQKQGESIDNFYIRVKEKVAVIEIDKLNKEEIIDLITLAHLVNNCSDKQVKHKAIRDDLSLENFMRAARASERAIHQMKDLQGQTQINKVGRSRSQRPQRFESSESRPGKQRRRSKSSRREKTCYRCGGVFPHKGDCPAKDKTCEKCKKIGHFAKVCHTKRRGNVNAATNDDEQFDEEYCVVPAVISAVQNKKTKSTCVVMFGNNVEMLIDSGSEINTINGKVYSQIKQKVKLEPVSTTYYGYGSEGQRSEIPIIGKFRTMIKAPATKRQTLITVHVIKGNAMNLMSCETSEKLGLVKFACAVQPKEDVLNKYKDRFEGIGKMKDVQVKLSVNKEVKPIAQKARRIPFHLRAKVDQEVERLKELDIIEDATGSTPWLSPLVIVHKANGQIRVCLDSRAINTAIERERYPMNTVEDLIVDLNGAKYFSKIDLNKGYHQLELAEESRFMTTLATHNGLFRYKRLCFGINSAAEIFQKSIADMLSGIKGVRNMSDDIIIFSKTEEEHHEAIEKVLECLRKNNITANKEKCEFWKDSITFFGHVFSKDGISPSQDKVEAIIEAEKPKSSEEVRSFLGMAQYLSRFIPNYSSLVDPLRVLTKKNTTWKWGKNENQAFEDLKSSMANWKIISYFNVKHRTEVIVDASPIGLGAVLTQIAPDGSKTIVEYASRKLADTETRYSQTEREALGVVWACEHFDHYLMGAEFVVLTDHQPLLGIMAKPSSMPTARLHRLFLRLQPYKVELRHVSGKDNPADFLSRHPRVGSKTPSKTWLDVQTEKICINAIHSLQQKGPSSISTETIEEETANDVILQNVMKCIASQKWSDLDYDSSSDYKTFHRLSNELCISDGLLLRGERIVIPDKLRERIIELAHTSHQGIVKTKQFLRETVWFPGIDQMVERRIKDCLPCQATTAGGHREPLKMTPLPDGPWKQVAIDFAGPFPGGEYILVVIDEYSRFPEVEILYSTSANATIPKLDAIFARQGIPITLKSDNGPPFNSEQFAAWSKFIGFSHRKVTPKWPEANGEAERFMRTLNKAVKTAKLEKGNWKQEIFTFLRHYRATPHSTTGLSPCEMLNGRKLRTEMPMKPQKKKVRFEDQIKMSQKRDERLKAYMKELADSRNRAQENTFNVGDPVLVKQEKANKLSTMYDHTPYRIKQKKESMITAENEEGKCITRNSSHFKKISEKCKETSEKYHSRETYSNNLLMDNDDTDNSAETEDTSCEIEVAHNADNVNSMDTNSDNPEKSEATPTPRRSKRIRKPPLYLKDYVRK